MFTLAVFLDVVTRTLGAPWLWLQQVTTAFFAWGVFVGMAAATRRNDHFYLTEITKRMTGAPRNDDRDRQPPDRAGRRGAARLVRLRRTRCSTSAAIRMPSLIPLTVYTAIVPIAGVLIACSRSSSSSTAGRTASRGPRTATTRVEPIDMSAARAS